MRRAEVRRDETQRALERGALRGVARRTTRAGRARDDDDADDVTVETRARATRRGGLARARANARATKKIARSRRPAWTPERRAGGDGDARGATDADMVRLARRTTVRKTRAVRVRAGKGPNVDRTTGYIECDNTGSGNIFAIEPRQLYTESPTSDKYAKQGLGGIGGVIVTVGVLGAVAFATKGLAGFEEANNEFANYNGPSVSALEQQFER